MVNVREDPVDAGAIGRREDDDAFVLAHLSDLHLGPLPPIPSARRNFKRTLGALNWRRGRRRVHSPEVAVEMMAAARRLGADHIVISGDLCNLGLPDEHEAARRWLDDMGAPDALTVVPGNHDIYSGIGADEGVRRWLPFMRSSMEGGAFAADTSMFPFVRILSSGGAAARQRVALIGLNSAIETPPFRAHGRLGLDQLASLAVVLQRTRAAGLQRVVVLHHPPLTRLGRPGKELLDAAALEAVLEQEGAELVLYGHNHRVDVQRLPVAAGIVTVAGVASGSAVRPHGAEPIASMNVYRFGVWNGVARLTVDLYERDADGAGAGVRLRERIEPGTGQ